MKLLYCKRYYISSILKRKVTNIKLDNNTILERDLLDDKICILDIRTKIDNIINCNIEMQIVDRKDIEKRLLFYWIKLYSLNIKSGQDYENLEKCIAILILDYNLKSLNEIDKYLTKWSIREENFSHIVLTDVMEIYIIELPKFNKFQADTDSKLNSWLKFINNPRMVNMDKSNIELNRAKKVLEEISNDKRERYLAELREKYIMDQKAIEGAGYDKGLEAGIQQGKKEKTIDIAKKMKSKNVDINFISQVTGLTVIEIQDL